ncbi:11890_t:CDS:2 [Ambispora gerdemannii]|uniref:11890_t:CDS:1 n=1 Tax=Ambispora gerdemannii TaxID=144530 RepID=A0A9N9F6I4_9GLOM|nr:11890_t:CDS:2 [Ambispora gerdemannii]
MGDKNDTAEPLTTENHEVINKYTTAADISNRVLKKVVSAAVDGAKIIELCKLGDKEIEDSVKVLYVKQKIPKGIGFPTCVSVNNIICHFSPLPSDPEAVETLKNGDLVKIQLGAQIDGYAAITATTVVVGATKENPVTGRKADVITAAHLAAEAAIRLIRPGLVNMAVTETIQKIARAFDTNSVEGMLSHQLEKNEIEGKKQIILNPNEGQRREFERIEFAEHEVYGVDILISTGEGKPKNSRARTTVYKKTDTTYSLKMKTSREVLNEIRVKFGSFPFPLSLLTDEKKARLGIQECATHELVSSYHVYQEKEDEYVAQFFFTVILTKNGPLRITNTLYDPDVIKSDKKLEDEEIKKLLATNLRPSKKKNKKKKAAEEKNAEKDENAVGDSSVVD